jgi:hypothetical protein
MQESTGAMLEGPRVTRATWLNLVWAGLICTFGTDLTFLVRWFVQSQGSAFASMSHLSPWTLVFTFMSFFFWVPLVGVSMFTFSFAALMFDQSWSNFRGRLTWLAVLAMALLLGFIGYSAAGSITQETLSAYPYAIVIGTAIVILQKRLIGRYLKRQIAR